MINLVFVISYFLIDVILFIIYFRTTHALYVQVCVYMSLPLEHFNIFSILLHMSYLAKSCKGGGQTKFISLGSQN